MDKKQDWERLVLEQASSGEHSGVLSNPRCPGQRFELLAK